MPRIGARRTALALFVAVCIAILAGSLLPRLAPPSQHHIDKYVHLSAYALLATLGCLGVPARRWQLMIAALMGAAAGIELAQSFVGRAASIGDLLASALGIALGYCFVHFLVGLQHVSDGPSRNLRRGKLLTGDIAPSSATTGPPIP